MFRLSRVVFALLITFSTITPTFAQQEGVKAFDENGNFLLPRLENTTTSSPLNCFDYYTFGSVQADLVPQVAQTVPGALLTFTGEVKSANPYPLLDGTLYVKIFHRSEKTFAEGDGNDVVDQFVVKDGITLPANGTLPVQYEWKVPVNAEGGEYYAAYFFTTAKRYNLMGLSFTDDVVGNQAPFTVTVPKDSSAVAKLSKISTTLNGKDHHFAAFPLHFAAGDTVTVKTTITNPTKEAKTMPLQWNQYAWDAMNKDNIRFTKTELVTLKPNETKTVTYEVKAQRESVVYVVAVTQDLEVKSILNVRYVRDGIEETRINFPGVTKFPLAKDSTETLFACAHSTNQPVVPGNTLTLTLKDRAGSNIHEYKYEGDISGAMSGFGDTFTPTENINYATLTATLERNGVIVEQVTQTYDCEVIDSGSCLPEERSAASIFDYLKNNFMIIILTGVVVLLLAAIGVFFIKKRRSSSDTSGGTSMTTPLSLLFFLLILPTMFFTQPGVGEAKSVSWNTTFTKDLYYYWDGNLVCGFTNTACSGWDLGLRNPNVTVTYQADMYNDTTNALIADGSTIPVGTVVRFEPKNNVNNDISWFGTGYSQDSPNGYWRTNAAFPGVGCAAQDYVGRAANSAYHVFAPLSVNTPNKTITHSGTAILSCNTGNSICTVTGPGSINSTITFASTYGMFYYAWANDSAGNNCAYGGTNTLFGPAGGPYPMSESMGGISPIIPYFQLAVPQRAITFNLTAAAAANQPPVPPTITGPTTGVINTAYTFNLTATDPENNTLRYGVDWDNNGSVDEWVPGTGYVNSGTSQSSNRSWATDGSYSFQALAQDSNGASSGWTSHNIVISTIAGGSCVPGSSNTTYPQCPLGYDYINVGTGGRACDVRVGYVPNSSGNPLVVDFNRSSCPAGYGSPLDVSTGSATITQCQRTCTAPITADLKINNSDGPVSVAKNTSVNLTWTSSGAVSCTKWGGAWGSGEGIALNGSDTTVVAASGTYMINCGGFIDSVDVVVVNQAPNPPTIAGTCTQAGVNNTFTITGTDPDNDNLFYEVDWNNDGIVDATTMTVTSGQSQPATYNWPTAGSYTFQARTVDAPPGGLRSAWTAHNVICPAAPAVPPTADINIRVNNADWDNDSPANIFPGDFIYVNWSSTGATNCTATGGGGFGTGNAISGTDNDVTEPLPGTSDTFIVSCTGPGGTTQSSFVVNTAQKPNFNKPLVSISSLGTFDPVTATYASVNVYFSTANNGGSVTKSSAPYMVELTGYPTQSGTIPSGLASGPIGYNNTVTIPGPLSFGTANIKVSIDTPISSNGSVDETTEGDADNTNTTSLAIPAPDPGLSITADRTRLRNGETTIIRWNIATPYTGLACEVYGPGMSINPATFSDDEPTQPISAKSEYTLKCTVAGTTFQKSVFVETEGEIEEI